MTLELTHLKQLRATIDGWRAAGDTIAFVPTMGALHRGHMTLVERAREQAKRVVVSIFVNPTQFGPNEDFNRYPRPREKDFAMLREEGVDAAWLPSVTEMYPEGAAATLKAGSAAQGLDGDARPGHFDGVATVVAQLLQQVTPDIAFFGEKDYQQLCVIKQLVAEKGIPVRIEGVPTVRESSGLALSSRNQYLSAEEHEIAPHLYKTLIELASQLAHPLSVIPAKAGIHCGETAEAVFCTVDWPRGLSPLRSGSGLRRDDGLSVSLERAKSQLLEAGFTKIDYLELRAEDTLAPMTILNQSARLLVAAWLGKTRLIDNVKVDYAHG